MSYSFYTQTIINNIRKNKPAIIEPVKPFKYSVLKCHGGYYGVYITSLSCEAVDKLRHKFGRLYGPALPDRLTVISGRIARKKTLEAANAYIDRLNNPDLAPMDYLYGIAEKLQFNIVVRKKKEIRAVKLQYYQTEQTIRGRKVKLKSSQNIDGLIDAAMYYQDKGINTVLHPTVSRTVILDKNAVHSGHEVAYKAKGLKGMTKDIKDSAPEFLRRIHQKRKRTTTNKFWKNRR